MRFRYASEEDELPSLAEYYRGEDADIIVAEDDGEIIGSAIYSEDGGVGTLEYVQVKDSMEGLGLGSALFDRVLEETDTDAFYAHATAMNGKIQRMLQNRGFEASGLAADKRISDTQKDASGGFDLNLWKMDERIQAYVPEELRDFTDTSLRDQREIDYLEPGSDELTGSFDILTSKLTGRGSERCLSDNRLEIQVGKGSTLDKHIQGAIDAIDADDYWAKTVKMDTTQPITHKIAKSLNQKGFKPVDLSPSMEGQELTMLDLGTEAGIYSVTDETLELIESTGLNYRIEGSDDQTTQITFQP